MRGGVTFFRAGGGSAARSYLERDHARADDYYLADGAGLADRTMFDGAGQVVARDVLTGDEYEAWVDWRDPITGEVRGTPRTRTMVDEVTGETVAAASSPRFAEMTINVDKSLSIAAAVDLDVSAALDAAMRDAADAMGSYLATHSRTRVGSFGSQRLVELGQLESAAVLHQTSRAGDPHRHIHLQFSTRVFADGKWRGLDTATTLRQQGALRGIGEAVIGSHEQLREALGRAGFTFDAATGSVPELAPFAEAMSKRASQITRNVDLLERQWRTEHPGRVPGPTIVRSWDRQAWALDRPDKKPTELSTIDRWSVELEAAGYRRPTVPAQVARQSIADIDRDQLASEAVALVSASRSAWSVADIEDKISHLLAGIGIIADRGVLAELLEDITERANTQCVSLAEQPGQIMPDSLRHLTSKPVLQLHKEISARLHERGTTDGEDAQLPQLRVDDRPLGEQQQQAVQAMAGSHQLVVIEGAAGSGKTTALKAAKEQLAAQGRRQMLVAPTLKAAQEAGRATGSNASSLHKLLREYGWRWDAAGRWTRLGVGELDSSGFEYRGPSERFGLDANSQIVVDEAGMVDQEAGRALLHLADTTGASVVLLGDRAQLAAVGRGGFLDLAVRHTTSHIDIDHVHRFITPDGSVDHEYAALSLKLRTRTETSDVFEQLHARGLIRVHATQTAANEAIASTAAATIRGERTVALTVATNADAAALNERVRTELTRAGLVDDERTTLGVDGLSIGRGDRIMARQNSHILGIANRETFTVTHVHDDGSVIVAGEDRRRISLDRDYLRAHTHLAYAVTDYGNQGVTTDTAHTLVSDRMSAGGGYVGATRGRTENALHFIAVDLDDARAQFVELMSRDSLDQGIDKAREKLREQTRGLDLADRQNHTKADLAERIAVAVSTTPHDDSTASPAEPDRGHDHAGSMTLQERIDAQVAKLRRDMNPGPIDRDPKGLSR